jgi:hypothetical protein
MTTSSAILDLASRFDGYMVPFNADICELRDSGLITTTYACEGFVIARAVPAPAQSQRWGCRRDARGNFVRRYLSTQLSDCQRPEAGT